jgi:signal transduction histidine kinase
MRTNRSPQVIGAKIQGTGLGLSIAKRSAEALGGNLTVSTQIGTGSVFTVHLPPAKRVRQRRSNVERGTGGVRA